MIAVGSTRRAILGIVTVAAVTALAGSVSVAAAGTCEGCTPWWHVNTSAIPTNLPPGGSGQIVVVANNVGDANATSPITISDRLPAGIEVTGAEFYESSFVGGEHSYGEAFGIPGFLCTTTPTEVTCTYPGVKEVEAMIGVSRAEAEAIFPPTVHPYADWLKVVIEVKVGLGAKLGANEVTLTGGEAPRTSIGQPVTVSGAPVPFGIEDYELKPEKAGGALDTQAGSHPFQLTATLAMNKTKTGVEVTTPALVKDLRIGQPQGLVGDADAVPQCSEAQFHARDCPENTALGVATTLVNLPTPGNAVGSLDTFTEPVYNLRPSAGEPARFGFSPAGIPVSLDTALATSEHYRVVVNAQYTNQAAVLLSSQVTLWGNPRDARHSESLQGVCEEAKIVNCVAGEAGHTVPFLTLPTSCPAEPLTSTVEADSWAAPGKSPVTAAPVTYTLEDSYGRAVGIDGCDALLFEPKIDLESSTSSADSPTDLTVHLKVPQEAGEAPEGDAESDVKNTTVTLPAGLQINPAAADGLQACSEAQVGFTRLEASGEAVFSEGEAQCPEASKLGTVEVTTPLLKEALTGSVYQAVQGANPFGSLLALYVVAENKNEGVRVKLDGKVEPNKSTGQLVSTFDQTPQLPFEEFDLKFFGGNQAPLATTSCGAYKATSSIEPWSGQPAASPFSEFEITTGPDGTPCPNPASFSPLFTAGTTNNAAGAFTPFVMNLTRKDGEQTLSTIALKMPLGVSGMVSAVTLCPEAQANAGDCPAASRIGHVRVSAGVGSEPVVLPEAGKGEDPVYLTGRYKGAPFGLSVIVPAEAGPFNLDEGGHPIVVRAKVEVDPHTAQVTVVSDPMPTRLQGIPLDVRNVEVLVDKPGFIFNPTNCAAMSVAGTIGSNEGASESVSSRYQAADCANLPFKPSLSASTQAKHTRNDGAYLHVVVKSSSGEANIGSVKVDLPKKLPSRLSTLKLACTEAQFAANPAGCPAGSKVGTATATTPVLPVALSGPAYFVSHGGAKFPELVLVLQGDNVTLELAGETFINSAGITSSTFRSVPDVPVTRFDLVLPTGPDSVLGGNGNFCTGTLSMPTEIKGQNGAVVKQETKVAVSGCKPTIRVVRHSVKGSKATVVASVPSAGKLIVTGDGLVGGTKTLKKAGEATIDLSLSKQRQLLLARHHGRKLKVRVHLLFKPTHGSHLSTSVTLLMR